MRISFKVVNYPLRTYRTDDVITKTDANLARLSALSSVSPAFYTEVLLEISLRWGDAYNEYNFKEIFMQGRSELVRYSLRLY